MNFQLPMIKHFLVGLAMAGTTSLPGANGHGLMEFPPSRNWVCGVVTKPDHVINNVALTPECGEAFEFEDGGYQFMSVLTHDVGRVGVNPLPNNVCGFDSESWFGGPTPWDAPMDWPTTPMAAGRNEIRWNIFWGNHFSDTEDFRYYITKPDFVFDPTRAVTWSDFEDTPFCELYYNDGIPNGNPDVIPLYETTQFRTFCDVPVREGHHVIYGEWGRNSDTFERFHGCIDASFDGTTLPPGGGGDELRAFFSYQPSDPTLAGEVTIVLDGSFSVGEDLSYEWSVTTEGDSSLYSLEDSTAQSTTLFMSEPSALQDLIISLLVTNAEGSSVYSVQITHFPSTGSLWMDFGQLQVMTQDLAAGTRLSFRTVDSNGVEVSYPSSPFVVDDSNRGAYNWPVALSNALSSAGAPIAVGVLNTELDQVIAQYSNTANRVLGYESNGFTLVQLQLIDPSTPTSSPMQPAGSPTQAPVASPTPAPISSPTGPSPTPAPAGGNPGGGSCFVNVRSGSNNPWHAGIDVGFDASSIVLDFSNTGLNLSQVNPQLGVFTSMTIDGSQMTLTKPSWLSGTNPGYLGIGGNNVPALATFTAPTCSIA